MLSCGLLHIWSRQGFHTHKANVVLGTPFRKPREIFPSSVKWFFDGKLSHPPPPLHLPDGLRRFSLISMVGKYHN